MVEQEAIEIPVFQIISQRGYIADALILFPALGCPAIAEWDPDRERYRIFVSMFIILQGRARWPEENPDLQKSWISHELGIEEPFDTHHNDDSWNGFDSVTHFTPESIELLTSLNRQQNKVVWYSQPNFIRMYKRSFREGFIRRTLRREPTESSPENSVTHKELMLTLPEGTTPGMYGLVCRSERLQLLAYPRGRRPATRSFGQTTIEDILLQLDGPEVNSYTSRGSPVVLHHPVYVPPPDKEYLNIAHLSDTHLSRRWDAMEYWSSVRYTEQVRNWRFYGPPDSPTVQIRDPNTRHWDRFNNPNRRFEDALADANEHEDVDIIIITGDLIDYYKGYQVEGHRMHSSGYLNHYTSSYQDNSNWPLFYELLINNYRKPVFTILGNHDYRYATYGLMASGQNFAYDLGIDVDRRPDEDTREQDQREALRLIYSHRMVGDSSRDSIRTSFDYVRWYNFIINPALDFMFDYRQIAFLFLDWRREEDLTSIWPPSIFGTPLAEHSLTSEQMDIFRIFLRRNRGKSAIVSMHASVFCTPSHLRNYDSADAIAHADNVNPNEESHLALGTFRHNRGEFIRQLWSRTSAAESSSPTVVLSGHTHKNRVYIYDGSRVRDHEPARLQTWLSLPIGEAIFCVTTSTAYREASTDERFRTPGYRIIRFVDGRIEIQLRGLTIPQNQTLQPQELPRGHPNRGRQ